MPFEVPLMFNLEFMSPHLYLNHFCAKDWNICK